MTAIKSNYTLMTKVFWRCSECSNNCYVFQDINTVKPDQCILKGISNKPAPWKEAGLISAVMCDFVDEKK
jgi:hypothetical protein